MKVIWLHPLVSDNIRLARCDVSHCEAAQVPVAIVFVNSPSQTHKTVSTMPSGVGVNTYLLPCLL